MLHRVAEESQQKALLRFPVQSGRGKPDPF